MTNGIKAPLEFSIQGLNLILGNGQRFDFKRLMVTLSYYEDLFSFCSSGSITVLDAQGFLEQLQFTGNEFIELEIGKIKDSPNNIQEVFRVYKIDKRKPSGNQNSEIYDFLFCSEEMFLSEQIKVSQSYKGHSVSDIVTDILTNKLKVSPNKIATIESTRGVYDFIVPTLKPFEAISWLSTYAMSSTYFGADMLFFQDQDGYKFRSLQSMYNDSVYGTYKYSAKNLGYDVEQMEAKQQSIQKYEFFKTYDTLNEVNSGTFANRLISVDPTIRSYYITDFDYKKQSPNLTTLNNNAPFNYFTNRLGKAQNESYDGVLKLAMSNQNEMEVDYIKNKAGSVTKNVFIEMTIPLRTAQISLSNYTKMKLTIPGDPGISVGKTIMLNIPSLDPTQKNKELDKFYSGKYIVTALRHVFTSERYQTLLEVAKESSPTEYQTINTTPDWNTAIKS